MMLAVEQFRDAILAAGLTTPEIIEADGKLHRFATNGKRGDDSGWYVCHDDGIPAGSFGDWRTGLTQAWRADVGRKLTPAEEAAHRAKAESMRKQREAEEQRQQAEAAAKAVAIWKAAQPAPDDHPYLARKSVKAHGLKVYRGDLVIAGMQCGGALIVPMRDQATELQGLQFVALNGDKRFLPGARVHGCYFGIGKSPNAGETLHLCEGYATGASVHEATGNGIAVAFNAGNLEPVARVLRAKFPNARLILCADDDYRTDGNPGKTKATEAARSVGGLLAVPDFGENRPEGATDFNDLALKGGAEAVRKAVDAASAPDKPSPRPTSASAPADTVAANKWPDPLSEVAFHGLAGDIARVIEPQTEADNAAILLQVLVVFGALVGRGPHVRVEGDEHHCNLFGVLVGETAKSRKGTSRGRVRECFSRIADCPKEQSGLSSGEGLKYAVRDAQKRIERDKGTGNAVEVETDLGVMDKRLLVVEPEFAQVLRQSARAGNTLSATIRCAWDTGRLATLTKNDPVTATGAHICIIGHITADELRAELTATDSANGFANRFLFMCVRRSKLLPHGGGPITEAELARLTGRIAQAVVKARTLGAVGMSGAAREMWERVYATLSEGHSGLLGAVTARAEAQCLRLALVFALMDEATTIDHSHLLAAIAIWERAEASARYIFGSALGDPVADDILRALRASGAAGVTRTGIRDLFKRHEKAERIGVALDMLVRRNLARCETQPAEGGRPAELWRAA